MPDREESVKEFVTRNLGEEVGASDRSRHQALKAHYTESPPPKTCMGTWPRLAS